MAKEQDPEVARHLRAAYNHLNDLQAMGITREDSLGMLRAMMGMADPEETTIYTVQCTMVRHVVSGDGDFSTISQQIPTFFLASNVQGVVDDAHAAAIARSIVMSDYSSETVNRELNVSVTSAKVRLP
jgi:hypothetical protein